VIVSRGLKFHWIETRNFPTSQAYALRVRWGTSSFVGNVFNLLFLLRTYAIELYLGYYARRGLDSSQRSFPKGSMLGHRMLPGSRYLFPAIHFMTTVTKVQCFFPFLSSPSSLALFFSRSFSSFCASINSFLPFCARTDSSVPSTFCVGIAAAPSPPAIGSRSEVTHVA
jgi:hypothetical protein